MIVLILCTDVSRWEIRQSMFMYIVSRDKARILSRLGSKHASRTRRTRDKPSLPPLLFQTVTGAFKSVGGKLAKARTADIRSQRTKLWSTFGRLEKAEDKNNPASFVELLKSIIVSAYEFDIDGLISLLENIQGLNPNLRVYLPEALRKIRRYYQVARNLTGAA